MVALKVAKACLTSSGASEGKAAVICFVAAVQANRALVAPALSLAATALRNCSCAGAVAQAFAAEQNVNPAAEDEPAEAGADEAADETLAPDPDVLAVVVLAQPAIAGNANASTAQTPTVLRLKTVPIVVPLSPLPHPSRSSAGPAPLSPAAHQMSATGPNPGSAGHYRSCVPGGANLRRSPAMPRLPAQWTRCFTSGWVAGCHSGPDPPVDCWEAP